MRSQRSTSSVLPHRTGSILLGLVAGVVAPLLLSAPALARDEGVEMLDELNAPWALVSEQAKSATRVFTAYLDVTKPPMEVGEDFNQTTIWPGMENFEAVAKWAEANSGMGKALVDVQNCQVLGVPYGTKDVDAKFVERGLVADVSLKDGVARAEFPYLKALETIGAYVSADMYRQCEAGRFDDAFALGIAWARVLRQAADATTFAEKSATMTLLCDTLSVQRDVMWSYRDKISWELFQKLGTKEYRYIKPQENERLKRLAMPEGDLIIGEAILASVFDEGGQPDAARFAPLFSSLQSEAEPLTTFGAARRWSKIAGVHGSLEASTKKLNDIYDDWWRRWRMRPYDAMMALPTEHSRANPIKYAAVLLVAEDIESLFELRRRLAAEICGTVVAAGLCGYRAKNEIWPDKIEVVYTTFFPKQFNFDPYSRDYGQLVFDYLGSSKRPIDGEFGLVSATGCVLYARNGDGESSKAARHAPGGTQDDFVLWPALRAISRGQGG
jgi:hypothetical protein